MSGMEMASWWLLTLAGGGLLLLLARAFLSRIRQPARRQRLAECAVAAALLLALCRLGPAWLTLPVLTDQPAPCPPEATAQPGLLPAPAIEPDDEPKINPDLEQVILVPAQPAAAVQGPPAPPPNEPWFSWTLVLWGLLAVYGLGAGLLLVRWLVGHLALWRLLRSAVPASPEVVQLCAEVGGGQRLPRLVISARVGVPFSFGLFRPTVVLPADLCTSASRSVLCWVLAHELAHLERRDARASLLFGLGQVVYFCFPWFWWLRRQVRLCQEYIADAAAVAVAGQPEDYAQFLLTWSGPLPAGVNGVSGNSSDLYRRISMLLQSSGPVERRCPRSWSLLMAGGLLGLAVVVGGVGLTARAAPAPAADPARKEEPKKDEPKKEEPKKDEAKKAEPKKEERKRPDLLDPFAGLEKLFENLPGGLDNEQFKQMREEMKRAREEMRRAMEMARQAGRILPGGVPNIGNIPNLGGILQNRLDRSGRSQEGRLGVQVEKPDDTLIEQLDLPRNQGLTIEEVKPDSAAAKAGVKAHDILLEVGGKAVPSDVNEFVKQLNEIKANTPVDVVVMRKGKKESLKGLSLPEGKAEARPVGQPRNPFVFPNVFPLVPGNIQGGVQIGGNGVTISSNRNGNNFTATRKEGNLTITVEGTVGAGGATPTMIQIEDGDKTTKYESVDKVPEEYREQVKQLIQTQSGKGRRIRIGR